MLWEEWLTQRHVKDGGWHIEMWISQDAFALEILCCKATFNYRLPADEIDFSIGCELTFLFSLYIPVAFDNVSESAFKECDVELGFFMSRTLGLEYV